MQHPISDFQIGALSLHFRPEADSLKFRGYTKAALSTLDLEYVTLLFPPHNPATALPAAHMTVVAMADNNGYIHLKSPLQVCELETTSASV